MNRSDDRYREFPNGFFGRTDDSDDGGFYTMPRLVTHIDDRAIEAVGAIYRQLDMTGTVLDVMSSWISHFVVPPTNLVALGMNRAELAANKTATAAVVTDLNRSPQLPFRADVFDDAVCCVSVDYLVRPLEVFDELARAIRPGGRFCCTISNRCFPTKAIAGWLAGGDKDHVELVARYFQLARGWDNIEVSVLVAPGAGTDPLYAVWATNTGS